jgi:hypothetical protein
MTPAYRTPSRHEMIEPNPRPRQTRSAQKLRDLVLPVLFLSPAAASRSLTRCLRIAAPLAKPSVAFASSIAPTTASSRGRPAHRPNVPAGRTRQRDRATLTAHAR